MHPHHAAAKGYFYRLIPPRPGFPADMSPDEVATMREHAAYWSALTEQGTVVAFGPVADPEGVYGVGIILAASRSEAEALRDGDPAIRSPHGFRGEIAPMMSLVTQAGRYDAAPA